MVPVCSSVMLELVLAVHSYHVIAYPDAATKFCSYSFSEACCDVRPYSDCEYAFGSFLKEGIILLQKYVDDPSEVQASQQESMLLQRLLDFIDDEGIST